MNKWLSGHKTSPHESRLVTTTLPISEDEDNYDSAVLNKGRSNNKASSTAAESTEKEANTTKSSFETNDSAIDVRSYSSISNLSKNSSRVNWHSFHKHYHNHFFQSVNTWSKYQISAMSLEQIMALRKLALIQFSKLVERQHSTMIKYTYIKSTPNLTITINNDL